MGYYISTEAIDLVIPAANAEKAYQAMCELNQHNDLKSGGRWPRGDQQDGPHDGVWFSWMNWNYDQVCENASEILNELGFETETDSNGNIIVGWYESKMGDELHFLRAIAPYVNDGSYIEWRGEDGMMWRSFFTDGKMVEQRAVITWE